MVIFLGNERVISLSNSLTISLSFSSNSASLRFFVLFFSMESQYLASYKEKKNINDKQTVLKTNE